MRRRSVVPAVVVGVLGTAWAGAGCAPAAAQTPAGSAGSDMAVRPSVYRVPPEAAPQEAPDPVPFLQVDGTGSVQVSPDRARVRFAVETEAGTAREASQENARRMDAVIRALRALDVTGLDVETSGYDLQPRYARPDREGTRTISGYTALNHVAVTADDVTAVGRIVDAAIGAGANRVASLGFEATNTEAARAEALRQAVAQARAEAQAMADALGVALGPPLEVRGGANTPGPRPMPMYRMEAAQADVSTPVEAQDQTITASVTIKYRLGGA